MACEKLQSSDISKTQIERKNSNESFYVLDSGNINIPFETKLNRQAYILNPKTWKVQYKYRATAGWKDGWNLPSILAFKNTYNSFCDFENDFKKMANHKSWGFLAVKPEYIEAIYVEFYKPRQLLQIQEKASNDSKQLKVEIQEGDYSIQDIPNLWEENIAVGISHLDAALHRLTQNTRFREITGIKRIDIMPTVLSFLPLIIKESFLLSNAESRSGGPYWYFQIDKSAAGDAEKFIRETLGVNKKYDRNINIPRSKIFEAINYVEKIENISSHRLLSQSDLEKRETDKLEVIDHIVKDIWEWQWLYKLLDNQKLSRDHARAIFDFNKQYNTSFSNIENINQMPMWTKVWIPKWDTGFYAPIDSTHDSVSIEKQSRVKFDFDVWINSIEVIWDELKWKVFVLDPWHGAIDPGAHPVALDSKWEPIKDPQSAIKVVDMNNPIKNQMVAPGKWSDYLHVYESLVTVDVSYRLAKLLRQQWADVYITRYNRTTWIIESANMTTPDVTEDIYSDTKKNWLNYKGNKSRRLRRWTQIANGIFDKSWKKQEDVYFLSIHADSLGNSAQPPMTFKYYKWRAGTSQTGKTFADSLAKNIEFRNKQAESDPQALYIIHPNKNDIKQSVLVELANMGDANSAYVLRQPWTIEDANGNIIPWRQQFADALFSWILATAKK